MFAEKDLFLGSICHRLVQSGSVPTILLSIVKQLLGGGAGSNIDTVPQSILSVSQIILCNSVEKRRNNKNTRNV